jgi:hypothetical protein
MKTCAAVAVDATKPARMVEPKLEMSNTAFDLMHAGQSIRSDVF